MKARICSSIEASDSSSLSLEDDEDVVPSSSDSCRGSSVCRDDMFGKRSILEMVGIWIVEEVCVWRKLVEDNAE